MCIIFKKWSILIMQAGKSDSPSEIPVLILPFEKHPADITVSRVF
jgi:hypothetical protein